MIGRRREGSHDISEHNLRLSGRLLVDRGDSEEAGLVLARDGADVKVLWFDAERLLELELVVGVVHDQVEVLEDRHQRDLAFLPGESATLRKRGSFSRDLLVVRVLILAMHARMPYPNACQA